MADKNFKEGTVIKGRDLKGHTLYKILSGDMDMCGIQYRLGMNEDTGLYDIDWAHGAGLSFCLAEDICHYLSCGEILALVSIPDSEDVYVGHQEFYVHRMAIEKTVWIDEVLNSAEAWECLVLNGADISAGDSRAVRWAAANGYLDVVEYLYEQEADIFSRNNYAVRRAAENGHLEIVKYLHKKGADITADNDSAVKHAAKNGHLGTVEYLWGKGADITADNNYAVRWAAANGHWDVVSYLERHLQ